MSGISGRFGGGGVVEAERALADVGVCGCVFCGGGWVEEVADSYACLEIGWVSFDKAGVETASIGVEDA